MRSLRDAIAIHGWMSPAELRWLRELALSMRRGARFYELGVWMGRSTVALAVDHISLTCVDTFGGTVGEQARWVADSRIDLYGDFSRNMRRLGLRPRVLKMDLLDAAALVPNGSLDGVFNDSDHDDYFEEHFWAWLPKVRHGGVYCGHDYSWEFPEIVRVLRGSGLDFTVIRGTSIWALIRP